MDLYEIRVTIDKIDNDFNLLVSQKKINELKKEVLVIEEMMLDSDFFADQKQVKKHTTILSANNNIINAYDSISGLLFDLKEYLKMLDDDNDGLIDEIVFETKRLIKEYNTLETFILLNEEYDNNGAILEIHCGAGGTESQDWVEMLYKMYLNYAKNRKFKIELLDISMASDVGIKSVTVKLTGLHAYGLLKNEKGVHRLIRISPFDSSDKRHTTFALVSVSPVLEEVGEIIINDSDLEIDTYRASGAGGQSVNTTDSAVRILHKPTKIVVTCQNQRSQLQNKQEALNVLRSKLVDLDIENKKQAANILKGDVIDVNFGSQIRTYVFHPYMMVKDRRSNLEVNNPNDVLNGDLDEIINSVLRFNKER